MGINKFDLQKISKDCIMFLCIKMFINLNMFVTLCDKYKNYGMDYLTLQMISQLIFIEVRFLTAFLSYITMYSKSSTAKLDRNIIDSSKLYIKSTASRSTENTKMNSKKLDFGLQCFNLLHRKLIKLLREFIFILLVFIF